MPERDSGARGAAHADYAYTVPPDQYLPAQYPGPYASLPALPQLPAAAAAASASHHPSATLLGASSSLPPLNSYAGYTQYQQPQPQQNEVHHWYQNQPVESAGGNPYPTASGEDMPGRTRRSTSRQQEAHAPTPTISSTRARRSTAAVSYKQFAADSDEEDDFKPAKGQEDDDDEVLPTRNTSRRYQQQKQAQLEPPYDHLHSPYAPGEAQPTAAAATNSGFLENALGPPQADSSLKVTLKFGGGDVEAADNAQGGLGDAPAHADGDEDEDAQGEEDPDAAGADHADAGQNGGAAAGAEEEEHGEAEENLVGGRSLRPRRGRVIDSEESADDFQPSAAPRRIATTTSSGRQTRRPAFYGESENEDDQKPQRRGGLRRGGSRSGYHGDGVEDDEDYQAEDGEYGTRRSTRQRDRSSKRASQSRGNQRSTRSSRRGDRDHSFHGDSTDADTDEEMLDLADDDDNDSLGNEQGANSRRLRNKPRVNYYAPLTLEAPKNDKKDKGKRRQNGDDGNPFAGLPANMTGAQWAALYPEGGQPSDSVRPRVRRSRCALELNFLSIFSASRTTMLPT